MKKGKAICIKRSTVIKDGKFATTVDRFDVRIMAMIEGWAMVRRKGCMPFVCKITDLEQKAD